MNISFSLPLDWISGRLARTRGKSGWPLTFKIGARYQINGEWFTVDQVLSTSLVMRLVNKDGMLTEAGS